MPIANHQDVSALRVAAHTVSRDSDLLRVQDSARALCEDAGFDAGSSAQALAAAGAVAGAALRRARGPVLVRLTLLRRRPGRALGLRCAAQFEDAAPGEEADEASLRGLEGLSDERALGPLPSGRRELAAVTWARRGPEPRAPAAVTVQTQFTIPIAGGPLELSRVLSILAAEDVALLAVTTDRESGSSSACLLVDREEPARRLLERAGLELVRARVVLLQLRDFAGRLRECVALLSRQGVRVRRIYGAFNGPLGGVVLEADQPERAAELLSRARARLPARVNGD